LTRPPARGTETVLLVEDDAGVRATAGRALTAAGYRVLTAINGAAALRTCEESTMPIDLVVTDIVMPHMSGPEFVRRLAMRSAATRVLFMSGYTEVAALRQSFLGPGDRFLEKPFTPQTLATAVRAALDEEVSAVR